jgi:hypothetical protein
VRERHPGRLFVLWLQASLEQVRASEHDGFCGFEDPTRAVVAIRAIGRFGDAFAAAGIPSAPEQACADVCAALAAARQIGLPLVLKILSPDIVHKSEIGGVLLDIGDDAGVRAGFARLIARARLAAT